MPKQQARGIRCSACQHLLGRTTNWLLLARRNGRDVFCSECADDIFAFVRTLRTELAETPARTHAAAQLVACGAMGLHKPCTLNAGHVGRHSMYLPVTADSLR